MRMPIDDELKQQQIVFYRLINFIMAMAIVTGLLAMVYKLGSLFFG